MQLAQASQLVTQTLQVRSKFVDGLVATGEVFGQRPSDHILEFGRHAR